MSQEKRTKRQNIAQIVVGSCVLGFPMAASKEVWDLSESLPWFSMIPIVAWSLFFLGAFSFYQQEEGKYDGKWKELIQGVLITYGTTLVCCAMTLMLVDKLPAFDEPGVAVKRMLLVAFPASFAATVVDAMK